MSFESLESFMAVCALRQHVLWPVPQLKHFYDILLLKAMTCKMNGLYNF